MIHSGYHSVYFPQPEYHAKIPSDAFKLHFERTSPFGPPRTIDQRSPIELACLHLSRFQNHSVCLNPADLQLQADKAHFLYPF